jgi:signal transduction histidine kinase
VRYAPVRNEDNRVAGVMGVAIDITETRQAQKEVLAHQEQLRGLTSQLLSIEDQERRKIATALHDSVGQILAFLKIELGTLQRLELPEEAAQGIARAREQIEEAVRQTRTLTFEISPPELYTLGLESALEELAQRFSQERQIECRVHGSDSFGPLNNELKTLLYRAVRELLTNAAKHAHPQTVEIALRSLGGSIQIAVKDDGTGFDASHLDTRSSSEGPGFGLLSIRERLTHMGGRMDIHSAPEEGTEVILTVPFENTGTSDRSADQ